MTPAALTAIPAGGTILLDTSARPRLPRGDRAGERGGGVGHRWTRRDRTGSGRRLGDHLDRVARRPLRARSTTAVRIVEDFLLRFPNLDVEPVTIAIAQEAARIRAATAVRTPDAIILATAVQVGATVVVGSDRSWPALAKRAGLAVQIALLDRLR